MTTIRRIAVLTGDHDAPGMNAAIRAVTRTALHYGWDVMGVCDGYAGLLSGDFIPLTARSVEGIVQRGGTMLGSSSNRKPATEAGESLALHNLSQREVDALIVIGGGAAQSRAYALAQTGFPVNGVAASVENDVAGFDAVLGFDTALNIALDTIDRLTIVKASGNDANVVEVAGRTCGYLALAAAVTSDAALVLIPEDDTPPEHISAALEAVAKRGVLCPLIVTAEGASHHLDRFVRQRAGDHTQPRLPITHLGHIQRRAAPSAFDRLLGTCLGVSAVDALTRGEFSVLAGSVCGETRTIPYTATVGQAHELDSGLVALATVLADRRYESIRVQ